MPSAVCRPENGGKGEDEIKCGCVKGAGLIVREGRIRWYDALEGLLRMRETFGEVSLVSSSLKSGDESALRISDAVGLRFIVSPSSSYSRSRSNSSGEFLELDLGDILRA
jgi:hypothetical protein